MKASCDSLIKAFRTHGPWIAVLLLCQCSMPPSQAWQYIRHNGLFTYWNYEATRPSPPFGASHASQRYIARTSYAPPRYSQRPASYWSSYGDAVGQPARVPYRSAPRSSYYNRYYALPTQPERPLSTPSPRSVPAPRSSRPRPAPASPPASRIPMEEPAPSPPSVTRNEPPAPSFGPMPKSDRGPSSAAPATADLPYGTPVPGRPNMVNSPYAGKTQLVDVSGMGVGQTVKCPYTGKLFKVPPPQQAANSAEPRLESKVDSPKMSSDPKAEDKKP